MRATAASVWTAVIAATSGSLIDLYGSGGEPAPIPGEKLVQTVHRMVGDAGQHVGEPGLWIDVVQLRGHDQRRDDGGPLGAPVRPGEQPRLASEGEASERALGRIVARAVRPSSRKRTKAGQRRSM